MTCTACSRAVERAVGKIDGVTNANVNFASEKLNINFDTSLVSISDIKKAVEKAGYKAIDNEVKVDTDRDKKLEHIKYMWKRFITSVIFTVPLLLITMGHMLGVVLPNIINPSNNPLNFALIQLILVTPVMIVGNKFFTVGLKTLIKRNPNMDSLIAIGASASYLYGIFSTYEIAIGNTSYASNLYFESAATILTLITLGKYLESVSKGKTSEAIKKLMGLTPKTAVIVRNEKEIELPIEEVEVGDIVLVKPGNKLPVDGIVLEGMTSIDESMLTGESIPVEKNKNDNVFGGSINKNGSIKYKATKIGRDTALAQIIKMARSEAHV